MSDFKSMLPDFKEVTSIANKLYTDVKKSVCEIVTDYKSKHCTEDSEKKSESKKSKTTNKK